jgi:hypothetical protein
MVLRTNPKNIAVWLVIADGKSKSMYAKKEIENPALTNCTGAVNGGIPSTIP